VADHPLRPATDRRLGQLLPNQLANRPRTPPDAPLPAFLKLGSPSSTLCGISPYFYRVSPTSGQVIHVLLTRPPLDCRVRKPRSPVRLACVTHAASVCPEPGSNSPNIHSLIPHPTLPFPTLVTSGSGRSAARSHPASRLSALTGLFSRPSAQRLVYSLALKGSHRTHRLRVPPNLPTTGRLVLPLPQHARLTVLFCTRFYLLAFAVLLLLTLQLFKFTSDLAAHCIHALA
jgi:hypothetical protein